MERQRNRQENKRTFWEDKLRRQIDASKETVLCNNNRYVLKWNWWIIDENINSLYRNCMTAHCKSNTQIEEHIVSFIRQEIKGAVLKMWKENNTWKENACPCYVFSCRCYHSFVRNDKPWPYTEVDWTPALCLPYGYIISPIIIYSGLGRI